MELQGERPVWSMSSSEKLAALDALEADLARQQIYRLHLIAGLDQDGHAQEIGAHDPAGDYLVLDRHADFATLAEAARRRGETAIGYRRHEHFHAAPAYGIVLNPRKDAPLTLTGEDRVLVLADGRLTDSSQVDDVGSLQASR